MFDSQQEIRLTFPSPEGDKTILVRYPTDAEWIERARQQKVFVRDLGRDQTVTETAPSGPSDLALLAQIRLDADGPEIDAAEAAAALSRLSRITVLEAQSDGTTYRIPARAPGGDVVHVLRRPSLAQMSEYRRAAAAPIDHRHGVREIRVSLQPSADLYDALRVSVAGYRGDQVPVIHKGAILAEVLRAMDRLLEGDGTGF